ncbi:hypothetical protein [Actinoplanes sp. NPDC051851]|uniref:hypothetical protein n=1 Tax=Actinoplanes sp. NPDC051851 TaxID=3154753 RepID=UPI0034213E5C
MSLALLLGTTTALPDPAAAAPADGSGGERASILTPIHYPAVAGVGSGGGGALDGALMTLGSATFVPVAAGSSAVNVVVFSPTQPLAFLLGGDEIKVYDTDQQTFETPFTIGATGTNIVAAVVSRDGDWLYAADSVNNAVYKIDTGTGTVSMPIPISSVYSGIALNQSGTLLYVARASGGFIDVYDTSTAVADSASPITVAGVAWHLTLSPDGTRILATIPGSGFSEIDPTTNAMPTLVGTSGSPLDGVYSPDGLSIYVVADTGTVLKYSAAAGNALESWLSLNYTDLYGLAVSPNGTTLHVVSRTQAGLVPIDMTTGSGTVLGTVGTPTVVNSYAAQITIGGQQEPAPPTITSVTPGSGQVSVAYTDGLNGGDTITTHVVYWSNGGSGGQLCTGNPCTITGVSAGSQSFTLRAVNQFGPSYASAPVQATVTGGSSASVPDAPTITSAVAGDGQVTLRFRDGSGNGSSITGHFANFSGGPVFCAASPCVISGLTNGTGYTFTVQAVNAVGNSPESVASETVTPGRLPGAPTITELHMTADGVMVMFTPPQSDTPIAKYQSQVDGGEWADLMAATIPGLKPGKHAVKLRAINRVGAGPASEAAWVTVPGTSTKPVAVPAPMAVAAASSARLSWKKSSSEGVTGYTVRANPGPGSCTTTAGDTDCVIGGTAGESYRYAVTVKGEGGSVSDPSKWSKSVTLKQPGLPSKLPSDAQPTLTTSNGKITSAVRGQKLTLIGSGFAAYSTVRIVIYGKARRLATVVTDAKGRFSKQVTIPQELTLGGHSLMAAGVDPDGTARRISMTFTVKR